MCGQEQAFRKWAADTFAVACETFCLDDDDTLLEVALSLGSEALSRSTVRFIEADPQPIAKCIIIFFFNHVKKLLNNYNDIYFQL